MPARKLTLLFEADTRAAITGIRSLADEVSRLNTLIGKSEGTDSLKSVVSSAQAFTNSLTQAQAKLAQLGQYNQVANNLSNWQSQTRRFNTVLDESLSKVRNIGKETNKSVDDLKKIVKPIDLTINAKLGKPDKSATEISEERLSRSQRIKADAEYIQKNFNRRVEQENREIRKDLAKKQIVETRQAQTAKNVRQSKGEEILAKLATPKADAFFKADELKINKPTGTKFATARQIEEARQIFESKAARRARNEKVFGSINQSRPENEAVREELRQNIGSVFNERLKQQVAINAEKKVQQKQELEEKYNALKAERDKQLKQEKEWQQKLKTAREKGLKYEEANRTTALTSTGIGFGASGLRTKEQVVKDRLASGIPTFRGALGSFGIDAISRRMPQGFQDAIQGTQMIAESLGMSKVAALGVGAAISGGMVLAISAANFGIAEFNRQLAVATKDQLALLGISSETQRLYGVDQKTADAFYQNLQTKTEIAGRDTSVSAEDITDLNQMGITSYITAFKDSGRTLEQLSDQIVQTNTRFAILAQATPGVTNFQVKNAYTSAITGNLNNALTRQEFFRNSGFADVVKQTALENKIDLTKATQLEQIDVLQKALEKRVPQSLVDRAQNDSIDAQVSSFQDKLFSQRVGIFGIQRDLDLNVEGNQSLFTEISRTVKLVLGKDGLFEQLGEIFSGVDFDLVRILRDGLRSLNDFLETLIKAIKEVNDLKNKVSSTPVLPGANVGDAFNAVSAIKPQSFTDAVSVGIAGGVPGLIGAAIVRSVAGFFGGNSYAGHIPESNSASILPLSHAINNEILNKPKGSNLLIANDSEYIFPNQQSVLAYASQKNDTISPVITVSPGAININAQSNHNPSDIANEVIHALNNIINFESQKYLK